MFVILQIANLAGLFTGEGFARKQGRRPQTEDCGYVPGPVDIVCSSESGTILEVSPGGSRALPTSSARMDASGLVATSAYVDSHTHSLFAGDRADEHFRRWQGASYQEIAASGGGIQRTVDTTNHASDEELKSTLRQRLQEMLAGGAAVIEVKSGYGGSAAGELRLLRLIKELQAENEAPQIKATFLGLHAVPLDQDETRHCTAMIEVLPVVAQEGLAAFADSFPEAGFCSLSSCLPFLQAALRQGLHVKVHADQFTNLGSSAAAVELGAMSVDHVDHVDDTVIRLLSNHRTVACLLPSASFFLGQEYANARRLIDGGARVALATDFNPGSAPACDFQFTQLLAAAKLRMSPAEILCASTYGGAAALRLEKTHGTIRANAVANLGLWDAQPLRTPSHASRLIEQIIVSRRKPFAVVVAGRLAISHGK
jgi:imidazolonepropionase